MIYSLTIIFSKITLFYKILLARYSNISFLKKSLLKKTKYINVELKFDSVQSTKYYSVYIIERMYISKWYIYYNI